MHLDTNLLLAAEKLRLDSDLVRGAKAGGTFAFKRVASQTYLAVNDLEGRVLEEFTQPRNVPEVLETCIRRRCCPALRDFYDLVLKAHRAGVLRSEELGAEGPPPALHPPLRWYFPLPAGLMLPLGCIGILATFVVAALRAPVVPANAIELLIGWGAAAAAFSLGHLLAGAIVRSGGGELHHPHIGMSALTPHFAFDLSDTCMIPRKARIATALTTVLPLALTVAAALWRRETWSLVPLAALLLACRPVAGGVGHQVLLLLRRKLRVATDDAPLFDAQPSFTEQCRNAWRRFDARVALLQFVAALAWAAAIGLTTYRCLQLDPSAALLDVSIWRESLPAMGAALGAVVLLWVANAIQYDIADALAATWRRWSLKCRRWLRGQAPLADSVDPEALIRRNPLLRRLDPERQAELAQHLHPFNAGAWRTLIRFDEEPSFVCLILSGAVTVYRRQKSGRKTRFLRAMEGDLFGAHKLVDRDFANLEVRSNTPLSGLVIDSAEFKRIVVDALGEATVRNYVHKHLFLQRTSPVCAEWRPAAVARFAELTGTAAHAAGGKIIARGQEVGNLYVMYDGHARAVRGKKPLGRIDPGDFFGEISLLQTSAATADVETKEDTRCLVVNRVEFIRFLSRNHYVALQMERLCSKRLGRPVFPLDERSFEQH